MVLGDVVIGERIIQYDLGRRYPGRFAMKDAITSSPNKDIRSFLGTFKTYHGTERLQLDFIHNLGQLQHDAEIKKRLTRYEYPGSNQDKLFASTYIHRHKERLECNCSETKACEAATVASCEELQCDAEYLISRQRLQQQHDENSIITSKVFLGNVGSADTVMKSAEDRDRIAIQHDLFAFEMEGAGLWDEIPSIVVKGVCDYADSHKNKPWQLFAAATAALTTKALLGLYIKTDRLVERDRSSG
jgi:nucleoside phosphorylase